MNTLTSHPRLVFGSDSWANLKKPAKGGLLRDAAGKVREQAEVDVEDVETRYPTGGHNEHLLRARAHQRRVVTLLTRWRQTGEERFRAAVIRQIDVMGDWEYWSWITWRKKEAAWDAIFDLSYGENSYTLAIAYDWLADTLTAAERERFVTVARDRSLTPLINVLARNGAWYYKSPSSNWNSVCMGGAGMLALAMMDELPELCAQVLEHAEISMTPFMETLAVTDGAWPEGIGYWNYGMRYAFLYLLSHERATGRRHPLLRAPAVKATLAFPADFAPHGHGCSFGDVNHWHPMPIHVAAASTLGMAGLARELVRIAGQQPGARSDWPHAAEWLLVRPSDTGAPPAPRTNIAKLYGGLHWGVLADRMPAPNLYLSFRGGTTKVPHGHIDLLSFHCCVKDEPMIVNLGPSEYLDTTFSPRRNELLEINPQSKNTILVNGVGITSGSQVATQRVRLGGDLPGPAYQLDATEAMGTQRDGNATVLCARLFAMLDARAILILDHVEVPHFARTESRFHTFGQVTPDADGALITGARQHLRLSMASTVPAGLHQASTAPTTPGHEARVIRWCTKDLVKAVTTATLLTPGQAPATVAVSTAGRTVTVNVGVGRWRKTVKYRFRPLPPAELPSLK